MQKGLPINNTIIHWLTIPLFDFTIKVNNISLNPLIILIKLFLEYDIVTNYYLLLKLTLWEL